MEMARFLLMRRGIVGISQHSKPSSFQRLNILRPFSTQWQPPKPMLFINNEFVPAEGDSRMVVYSPRNAQLVAEIANASNNDVDKAIASARACFNQYLTGETGWPNSTAEERSEILRSMSKEILRRVDEFAYMESIDCGKPIRESYGDIKAAAQFFEYYADLIKTPETCNDLKLKDFEEGVSSILRKEPLGVIGCITPWNYPLMQAVVKVAPALAAGCSIVLKPSPVASLTCLMLGEVALKCGLPPGALNVITGGPPGTDTGIYLGKHPDLDKMSFTGSSVAGSKLLSAAAPLLRPTGLELGGKGAMVVSSPCVASMLPTFENSNI
jgi:betaine-aldehyde dehydrogenase